MFTLPSSLAFLHRFGREKGDGITLGAVDVLCETPVVACIHGMSEHAADYD